MSYLIDTDVVSELRKRNRADPFVVVTRNVKHIAPTGARHFDPFGGPDGI